MTSVVWRLDVLDEQVRQADDGEVLGALVLDLADALEQDLRDLHAVVAGDQAAEEAEADGGRALHVLVDAALRGHDVLERADVTLRADAAEGLGGVGAGEVLRGVAVEATLEGALGEDLALLGQHGGRGLEADGHEQADEQVLAGVLALEELEEPLGGGTRGGGLVVGVRRPNRSAGRPGGRSRSRRSRGYAPGSRCPRRPRRGSSRTLSSSRAVNWSSLCSRRSRPRARAADSCTTRLCFASWSRPLMMRGMWTGSLATFASAM